MHLTSRCSRFSRRLKFWGRMREALVSDREEANKIAIVGMSLSCAGGGRREYWRQLLSTADQSRKAGNSESKLSLAQKLIREAIADANLLNEKTIDVIFHIDSEARASLAALLDLPSRQVRVDSLSNSLANISLAGRELQMRSADTIVVGDVYPDAEDLFGAVVVLRRLEDAERDGNFIYAMLKTSCALEDKSGSSDFVALLKQTYERLDPRAVGLVQICSADDTQVGLESLRDVFGPSVGVVPWCAVGNGNHCGVASVITAALSLHNAILPTAQFGANAFHINDEKTPFYLSVSWILNAAANTGSGGFAQGTTWFFVGGM